jgi:hypothetical protein
MQASRQLDQLTLCPAEVKRSHEEHNAAERDSFLRSRGCPACDRQLII